MTPDVPPAVAIGLGLGLAIVAFALYRWTFVERFYDHFVWQAAAFLEGRAGIRYPVATTADHIGNWFFQDVLPIGRVGGVDRGLIPFPPLPAILLMPFVAVFGLDVDDQLLFTALAAVDVALCWWMLGRLGISTAVRAGTTTFFAFGTVFWYTAQTTTTWYQAHIVAVGLTMLAVGLALGTAAEGTDPDERPPTVTAGLRIGLLVGLATTARLTVLLALPFFLLVGRHRGPPHAAWIAAGAGLPVLALLAYNVVATGQVFHPAYDHLYQLEARAYTGFGYRPDWAAEDPRYLPANLALMLLATPQVLPDRFRDTLGTIDRPLCTAPDAERTLFDPECPLAMPRDTGMSVLLTSPAFLLAIPAWLDRGRRRLVVAAVTAILLVSIANLMHFSQGWVQFGYRFSNDVVPFALVITAIGFSRLVDRAPRPPWAMPLAMGLITVSIGVNLWGVIWSRVLGW